jgi:hypothetical protein
MEDSGDKGIKGFFRKTFRKVESVPPAPPPPNSAQLAGETEKRRQENEQNLTQIQAAKDKLIGTGLTGTFNPYITEIETSGTIAGQPAAEVEARIKKDSTSLKQNEHLSEVLKANQDEVNKLRLTHHDLADPLQRIYFQILESKASSPSPSDFTYQYSGYEYHVHADPIMGFKVSPLFPNEKSIQQPYDGSISSFEPIWVSDDSDNELPFSPNDMQLIRDIGFYGSDPHFSAEKIARFFHLTPPSSTPVKS